MAQYDWLDLTTREHQLFLLQAAEDNYLTAKKVPLLEQELNEKTEYIAELEKHIDILQKTLALVRDNKRKVVLTYRRKKNVRKNHSPLR